MLLEDFETQASQKTTTKTEVAAAKKTGEVIRTEVIADVDAILTNLETLSAQITESFINEYSKTVLINENAGEALLKMFKSMGSLAKLSSTYPKMADNKAKLESDKKLFGLKFAEKQEELIAQQMDKAKEAMNAKIDALDDPAQKKQQREMRDTKLEALKGQIKAKIDRTKEDKDKKFDRDIADAGSALSKLTADNKMDSPILSAKWDGLKLQTDRKIEDKYTVVDRKSWDEFIEDPERIAQLEKSAKERAKKDAAEKDEQLKKSIERARIAQEKLDADIQNATGAEKEALEKLNDWNKAYTELNSTLNLTEESTPEEKKAAQDASTKLGDAQDKLSKKTMKDAFGYEDDQDADSALSDFTERESELQDKYKEIKSTIGGNDTEDDDNTEDIEAAKEELTTAIDGFKTEIDNLPKNDAGEVNPRDKAAIEVKKFTAEIKLAKINGEDTADLESKLQQATNVANLQPVPAPAGGGEPVQDNNSLEVPYVRPLVEASVSGLMASDDEEDGYKYLKQQAKKLGVKISVDKDPWGDGYDELTFTGAKSAIMKLAAISGHDEDMGTEEEGAAYVISETTHTPETKTIKLDEGMSVAEKFAILMNK